MSDTRFETLCRERRTQADAAANLLGDGLKRLLADLYPDQAHFLYELLQNAEDAGASTAEFILESDRLLFSHDGSQPFSFRDVEAITTIKSTKRDDDTKIGKFGVGFKAVFSYTTRPEVRSGEFSFAIEDLFVPVPTSGRAPVGRTDFVFPFNSPEKPCAAAYDEIGRGLAGMAETTLLFLKNIKSIQFVIDDGRSGELLRVEHGDRHVSVRRTEDDSTIESHWLRLLGGRRLSTLIPKGHYVAAAFQLDGAPTPRAKGARSRPVSVVPVDRGSVCVYFPAEKQVSGLKFHVHAPFEPTPARDSIRNTPENAELVTAIGKLIANALDDLRRDGWLNDGLLAALPNHEDSVGEMFGTVVESVRRAFWEHAITPSVGGAHLRADALVQSPPEFRRALTAPDLETLTRLHPDEFPSQPRWLVEREARAGVLLAGLGIPEFGWEELDRVLDLGGWWFEDDPDSGAIEGTPVSKWIRSLDDARLAQFYELLGQGVDDGNLDDWSFKDTRVPLLRVVSVDGVDHPVPPQGYLPAHEGDTAPGRVPLGLSYFDQDRHSRRKARLAAFYEALGVRRWDERATIETMLRRYEGLAGDGISAESLERHIGEVRVLIDHVKAHPDHVRTVRERILLAGGSGENLRWFRPSQLYLDSPVEDTGLEHLMGQRLARLSSVYLNTVEGIAQFAKAVGVVHSFAVRECNVWDNPAWKPQWNPRGTRSSGNGRRKDWDLPEAVAILRSRDPNLLRALWDLAVRTPKSFAEAIFQLNGSSETHYLPSMVAQRLRGKPWVLDYSGALRTAESMSREELPPDWPAPAPGSLALALGFGADVREQAEEHQAKARMARELGLPPHLLPHLVGRDPDDPVFMEIEALLAHRPTLPEAVSSNPGRRAQILGGDAALAPEYLTEMRERTVAIGSTEMRAQARQYLRAQYRAADGRVYCQVCLQSMPFRIKDHWYFETVQCVPRRARRHHQNALALCPLCAALYKHARTTPDQELLDRLLGLELAPNAGHVFVSLTLDGRERQLRFTGVHMLDLRTVLHLAGERLVGAVEGDFPS